MNMDNVPAVLRNAKGLRKMKALYAAQVAEVGEHAPSLRRLRNDIETVERGLQSKPLVFAAAAPGRR